MADDILNEIEQSTLEQQLTEMDPEKFKRAAAVVDRVREQRGQQDESAVARKIATMTPWEFEKFKRDQFAQD